MKFGPKKGSRRRHPAAAASKPPEAPANVVWGDADGKRSNDGKTFQPAGGPVTFDPPAARSVYVGLAIAAATRGNVNQARFSNLEVKAVQ